MLHLEEHLASFCVLFVFDAIFFHPQRPCGERNGDLAVLSLPGRQNLGGWLHPVSMLFFVNMFEYEKSSVRFSES